MQLDDLEWADDPTLGLFEYVARELAGSRVMIVSTVRPEPTSPALSAAMASLSRLPGSDRIDLYGLELFHRFCRAKVLTGGEPVVR